MARLRGGLERIVQGGGARQTDESVFRRTVGRLSRKPFDPSRESLDKNGRKQF